MLRGKWRSGKPYLGALSKFKASVILVDYVQYKEKREQLASSIALGNF